MIREYTQLQLPFNRQFTGCFTIMVLTLIFEEFDFYIFQLEAKSQWHLISIPLKKLTPSNIILQQRPAH